MEGGQLNKSKVGFIIQARIKSTRLPGKILKNLPFNGGKPLLKWITDTIKRSNFEHKIIIASSVNTENDILEVFAKHEKIQIFRGDEENVLSRFIAIVKENDFDVVVRLTADNPIIDLDILEKTITEHIFNKKDYTKTEGLPVGMNFEIIDPKILLSLENENLSPEDYEHVTLFTRNNSQNKMEVNWGTKELEKLRLTVDYPSDFASISLLLSLLEEDEKPSLAWIENILQKESWIFDVNQSNVQKRQYLSEAEERNDAIAFLNAFDFKWTAKKIAQID